MISELVLSLAPSHHLPPISASLHRHPSHRKAFAAPDTDAISALLISVLRCVEISPVPQREAAGAQPSMARRPFLWANGEQDATFPQWSCRTAEDGGVYRCLVVSSVKVKKYLLDV